MHWNTEGFLLEIGDDGAGFDPASAFPGYLDLHSMRERATRLGGMLQIESAPGHVSAFGFQLLFEDEFLSHTKKLETSDNLHY